MYFTFIEHELKFKGELLYIQDEYSLLYKPWNTNVGFAIICGEYTALDTICETGRIVHISGLNSKHLWVAKELKMPKAKTGELFAHFDEPPLKGSGLDYNKSWKTYYDNDSSCICIGNPQLEPHDEYVEFAHETVAVLRSGQIIAVWAKIKEVETLQ